MERLTEDMVRDKARSILGFEHKDTGKSGIGQLTTFNQLGFKGISDKPDGWYFPDNHMDTALILEVKASNIELGDKQVEELLKNVKITQKQYKNVVGILYNGEDTRVFKGEKEFTGNGSDQLQNHTYYTSLFEKSSIDKQYIYELTAKINNYLHFEFGIKNLYHRMIFTACALVAKRYDALMVKGMDYSEFHNAILNCLNKELMKDKKQNQKLSILEDVFAEIKMNLNVESEDAKEQQRVKDLIAQFIDWVTDISNCLNSDAWRGEDVMGIFFNEFNRYKKKSESGQIFTPEHITDFMYRILEVNKNDRILDACCGSGGFLVKAMANMIQEAGGPKTDKAKEIQSSQLFGIEFDREIYALACANMLIHKDGKTNLEQSDARTEAAGKWIAKQKITKVLMNPPYENKYGCIKIVENVLDNVPEYTMCGFILPDKKLEKTSKKQIKRILKRHRLRKIIKLPEDVFNAGVTTSIFIFEAHMPQDDKQIFACWMKSDGLVTVKNKGRHDIYNKWPKIEDKWVDIVIKQSGDDTCQWINPNEHLSYQMPQKNLEISEQDFKKTTMDYIMFQKKINIKDFSEKLFNSVMYSSDVQSDNDNIIISLAKKNDINDDLCYSSDSNTQIELQGFVNASPSLMDSANASTKDLLTTSVEQRFSSFVNANEWKEFKIEKLFEISRPKKRSQTKYAEGNIPFVASGNYNNGVVKWCAITDGEQTDSGNCITVSPIDGSAFYQKDDFLGRGGAGSAILILRNDNLTELSGLFIAAVIHKTLTKYSYVDQLNLQTIADEVIKLPATKNQPDWNYMEQYMRNIMNISQNTINTLTQLKIR